MATTSTETQRSTAEIMNNRQNEIVETWIDNIFKGSEGGRTRELMSEKQLRAQCTELLRSLTDAFMSEDYEDITRPEFADPVAMLRDISASRAEQGFTPSETAIFIFSLKDSLLEYFQSDFGDDPELLNNEVVKMNKILDRLGIVTFETFAISREKIIAQQSRSLLELSTPAVKLWDEVLMMPLVGVIDTTRSQQIMETLLEGIVATESRVAILDVSGVPVIDTRVAQHLISTANAAQMLGAEVVMTGISPEAAQTLVKLGIDLGNVITRGTLRSGVEEAFKLIQLAVTKR